MYTITKEFQFSASHQLQGLPDAHPCSRLHGHNYRVEFVLRSAELSSVGFVRDYRVLDVCKQYLDSTLDHRHLNDVLPVNPTAELLAEHLYYAFKPEIPELVCVRVSETEKTWAEYTERV